jgi:hypothetical protein
LADIDFPSPVSAEGGHPNIAWLRARAPDAAPAVRRPDEGRAVPEVTSAVQPTVTEPQRGPARQKVLFIMGMTRSGSTILASVLGELDGFFAAGELRLLWKRGLLDPRECGCGRLVGECELWGRVLKTTVGDEAIDEIDPRDVVSWQRRSVRLKHTWRLVRREPGKLPRLRPPDYSNLIAPLFHSLATLTGARVIVDSSKRPSDAALLRLLPELDVYFLHLVRDPRAVAYSWRRVKSRSDSGGPGYMARHGPIHSTLRWAYRNLGARAVAHRAAADRVMLLQYERFVAEPRAAIEAIARFVGEDGVELPFIDDNTVYLERNHVLSGNPSRFRTGAVSLVEDAEWRRRQTLFDRATSTAFALPMLRAYGYDVRPRRRNGG